MKVYSINTNHNFSFCSVIKPTNSLKDGFQMMEKYVNTSNMKDMNSVKDFVDSLVRISESKRTNEFKIDIDRARPNYTYTKINGRRVNGGHNEHFATLQDSYLVVEGVKRYASKCEKIEPSILDSMKAQIEEAEKVLDNLKERYENRLRAELEQAQKLIFKDAE